MKRFKTLRVRFALWTATLMLLVLISFGSFVYFNTKQGLIRAMDDSLRLSASQAIEAIDIENGQINFSDSLPDSPLVADLQEHGFTIRILALDGKILQSSGIYRSLPVDPSSFQKAGFGNPVFSTVSSTNADQIRVYTAPIMENQGLLGVIQIMQSMGSLYKTLDRLLVALLVSIPVLLIISASSGYYLAARALFPIDQITQTAQRISAEDLSGRLNPQETNDEVGRLEATLDNMLARLENAFRHERQFTADASHELRTPMAATQAILGVTLEKDRTPQEYRQALRDISDETDRMQGLVENLLFLARGDQKNSTQFEIVDFSHLLLDTAETLRPLAEGKGLRFNVSVPEEITLIGNSDGLIRLFINLLDNAIKFTSHGEIRLLAWKGERFVQIKVSDTGSGILDQDVPHIFDRFYRVDTSRSTRGSGLGLAIAQEIVHQHGGEMTVTSQVDQGTVFTVCLPIGNTIQTKVVSKS
jgi:heavy metal sensor kinase